MAEATTPTKKSAKPTFSIVIPTLNEEVCLPVLLRHLSKQEYPLSDLEVIIVDGNSEDETVRRAERFSTKLDLKIHSVTTRHVSYQRNYGAQRAKGAWIIFMDADNELPVKFMAGIRYQLAQHLSTDVFTTWIEAPKNIPGEEVVSQAFNLATELFEKIGKAGAVGALIGARRSILKKISFDTEMKIVEDGYFIRACISAGYTFTIFREPKFIYSFRRYYTEGALKSLITTAKMQIGFLRDADFTKDNYGYEMTGGSRYKRNPESIISQVNAFLRTSSRKQLELARELYRSLKD